MNRQLFAHILYETSSLEDKAVNLFGLTVDHVESKYLTTDGQFLGIKNVVGHNEHKNYEKALGMSGKIGGELAKTTGMIEMRNSSLKGGLLNFRVYTKPTFEQLQMMEMLSDDAGSTNIEVWDGASLSKNYDNRNLRNFFSENR